MFIVPWILLSKIIEFQNIFHIDIYKHVVPRYFLWFFKFYVHYGISKIFNFRVCMWIFLKSSKIMILECYAQHISSTHVIEDLKIYILPFKWKFKIHILIRNLL